MDLQIENFRSKLIRLIVDLDTFALVEGFRQ